MLEKQINSSMNDLISFIRLNLHVTYFEQYQEGNEDEVWLAVKIPQFKHSGRSQQNGERKIFAHKNILHHQSLSSSHSLLSFFVATI